MTMFVSIESYSAFRSELEREDGSRERRDDLSIYEALERSCSEL